MNCVILVDCRGPFPTIVWCLFCIKRVSLANLWQSQANGSCLNPRTNIKKHTFFSVIKSPDLYITFNSHHFDRLIKHSICILFRFALVYVFAYICVHASRGDLTHVCVESSTTTKVHHLFELPRGNFTIAVIPLPKTTPSIDNLS